jgi:GTP-binding protein
MSLRNVAIIAHVDHGKTTLVDQLFRQSGTFRDNQRVEERAMDSNDLEKERGITILAKCTSVEWEHDGRRRTSTSSTRPATPISARGGAHPVDGRRRYPAGRRRRRADAADQVRHRQGARARPEADRRRQQDRPPRRAPAEVLDECFELFLSLDANDEQLDFPGPLRIGRNGYAGETDDVRSGDLTPMFEKIVSHVPRPASIPMGPFKMLATLLDRDNFLGRILTGRIESGRSTSTRSSRRST